MPNNWNQALCRTIILFISQHVAIWQLEWIQAKFSETSQVHLHTRDSLYGLTLTLVMSYPFPTVHSRCCDAPKVDNKRPETLCVDYQKNRKKKKKENLSCAAA